LIDGHSPAVEVKMENTRNPGRARAILGAQIIFNNRNSTVECQIRNISSKGARICFTDAVSVPEEFELFIPQKGTTYRARMRWRDTEGAGLEFIDGEKRVEKAMPDTTQRIAALEKENARLRLRVSELLQRLGETAAYDENVA
jgi:hypothetical protein